MKVLIEISKFTRQFKLINLNFEEVKELEELIQSMDKYGCEVKIYDMEEEQ